MRRNVRLGLLVFLVSIGLGGHSMAVDIASYGACSGTDGSAGIQAAIDAANQSLTDNEVIFSCKAWVKGAIEVERPAGMPALTLKVDRAGDGIRVHNSASATKFFNLQGGRGYTAVVVDDCDDCVIEDLTIDGNSKAISLLAVRNSSSVTVDGNTFRNVGSGSTVTAVVVTGDNVGNTYSYNTVDGSGADTRGLWFGNANFTEVDPEIVHNTVTETGHTGLVFHGTGAMIRWNSVTDTQTKGAGIIISSSADSATHDNRTSDVDVWDNTLTGNAWHGVQSDSIDKTPGFDIRVERNVIKDNEKNGVSAPYADSWLIDDNTIEDNGTYGVILKGAHANQVTNNGIKDTRTNVALKTQIVGIYVLADTANGDEGEVTCLTILDNVVTGHLQEGIKIGTHPNASSQTVDTVLVDGNTVSDNNAGSHQIEVFEQGSCATTNVTLGDNGGASVLDTTDPTGCPSSVCPCSLESDCDDDPGCGASSSCPTPDTGVPVCERADDTVFNCSAGTTIHEKRCFCTGGICALSGLELVCQ